MLFQSVQSRAKRGFIPKVAFFKGYPNGPMPPCILKVKFATHRKYGENWLPVP
jgi:hypothetical protein